MKLYNTVKSAIGLACVGLLALSASAHAGKSNPLAAVMGTSEAQMTIDQAGGVTNARLLKLLAGTEANRGGGVCGDSEPDIGEECDDGNLANGDGCSSVCTVEPGSDCTAAVAGINTSNVVTNGGWADGSGAGWTFGPARGFVCANFCFGVDLSSDGDEGFVIFGSGGATAIPDSFAEQTVSIPGNATTLTFDWFGAATTAPACDDGGPGDRFILSATLTNLVGSVTVFATDPDTGCDGDYVTQSVDLTTACPIAEGVGGGDCRGTDVTIRFDADYPGVPSGNANIFLDNVRIDVPLVPPIDPVPSSCYVGTCGDSIVSDGEACDDGNTDAGDGCSATCTVEEVTHACINELADTGLAVAGGALGFNDDIIDGGLETGAPNAGWTEAGTVFAPICSEAFCGAALANDGDFFAWFGGSSMPNSQTLTQEATISTAATALTFDLLVGVCDSPADVLRVNIDGNLEFEYFCTTDTDGYETQSIDLAAGGYNDGGMHTIEFAAETSSTNGGNSNFFVDNIAAVYAVTPDRAGNGSACFELDTLCETPVRGPGFGIEQFESGLGIMSTFELGTLSAPNAWTTTADEWTVVGDPSGCGTADTSVANWPGGNQTGGSGEAACLDSDGGAESLASPDAGVACIDAVDPTLTCQTKGYLCTPSIDTTNQTDPGVTADVGYQTATQDFETEAEDDEVLRLLVGDVPPNAFTIANYRSAGVVLDHNSGSLATSGPLVVGVNLDDFRNPAVQGCVDPLEDPPCTLSGFEPALAADNLYVCFEYAGIYSWYAQVDNVAMRADNCTVGDADFDLVPDDIDNCTNVANPDQIDADGDGHGNLCDADFNNSCGPFAVNAADLALMRAQFFTNPNSPNWDAQFDLDSDGIVTFPDLAIMGILYFGPAGPSAPGAVCN